MENERPRLWRPTITFRRRARQIVAFYEEAERRFDIHNKNNAVFVDNLFGREILGRGLIYNWVDSHIATLTRPDSILSEVFARGYATEPTPLWALPPGASEWSVVRSVLLQRIRASAYGRTFAEQQLADSRALREAIEAELGRKE